MNKKFVKMILTMVCAVSMFATVLPVSAANVVQEDTASVMSSCSCIKDLIQVNRVSCTYVNLSDHRSVYVNKYECKHGISTVTEQVPETHAFYWKDVNHEFGQRKHEYQRICSGCGYAKTPETINCYYEDTGSHIHP